MIELNVPDMSCGHCVAAVTKAVKSVDAEATVNTDLVSKTVTVESRAERKAIEAALDDAGYPVSA